MRIKPGIYFLIGLIVLSLVFVVSAFTFPEMRMKIMPLFASSLVFVLAAIQISRELIASRQNTADTGLKAGKGKEKTGEGLGGSLLGFVWFAGIIVAIYLFGFLISIPAFLFLYLKLHGKKWLTSVVSAISTVLVIYVLFVVALQVDLYPGLILGGH
jgi:hypothetical protein